MKAKILVEPGCEAGSEFCTGCTGREEQTWCIEFDQDRERNTQTEEYYRCQPCLYAEQNK